MQAIPRQGVEECVEYIRPLSHGVRAGCFISNMDHGCVYRRRSNARCVCNPRVSHCFQRGLGRGLRDGCDTRGHCCAHCPPVGVHCWSRTNSFSLVVVRRNAQVIDGPRLVIDALHALSLEQEGNRQRRSRCSLQSNATGPAPTRESTTRDFCVKQLPHRLRGGLDRTPAPVVGSRLAAWP